jgi:hypothetical protein
MPISSVIYSCFLTKGHGLQLYYELKTRFGIPHLTNTKSEIRKGFLEDKNDNGHQHNNCGVIVKMEIAKVITVFLNWTLLRIAKLANAYQD